MTRSSSPTQKHAIRLKREDDFLRFVFGIEIKWPACVCCFFVVSRIDGHEFCVAIIIIWRSAIKRLASRSMLIIHANPRFYIDDMQRAIICINYRSSHRVPAHLVASTETSTHHHTPHRAIVWGFVSEGGAGRVRMDWNGARGIRIAKPYVDFLGNSLFCLTDKSISMPVSIIIEDGIPALRRWSSSRRAKGGRFPLHIIIWKEILWKDNTFGVKEPKIMLWNWNKECKMKLSKNTQSSEKRSMTKSRWGWNL